MFNNAVLPIQEKLLVSTKAIQLRDLSQNVRNFSVGNACANLTFGPLII